MLRIASQKTASNHSPVHTCQMSSFPDAAPPTHTVPSGVQVITGILSGPLNLARRVKHGSVTFRGA